MSAALKRQHSSPADEPLVVKDSKPALAQEQMAFELAKANLRIVPSAALKGTAENAPPSPVTPSSPAVALRPPMLKGDSAKEGVSLRQQHQQPTSTPQKQPSALASSSSSSVTAPAAVATTAGSSAEAPGTSSSGADLDDIHPVTLSPLPKKGIIKQKGKRLPRKPMRVYNEDDAYKSLALSTTATADEIIKEMAVSRLLLRFCCFLFS